MQPSIDDIAEAVLNEMAKSQSGALNVGSFITRHFGDEIDRSSGRDAKGLLEENGLIKSNAHVAGSSLITPKGQDVFRKGGWKAFKETSRSFKLDWERRQALEVKQLETSILANEWIIRSRWLPHILSGASFVVALMALFRSFGWI